VTQTRSFAYDATTQRLMGVTIRERTTSYAYNADGTLASKTMAGPRTTATTVSVRRTHLPHIESRSYSLVQSVSRRLCAPGGGGNWMGSKQDAEKVRYWRNVIREASAMAGPRSGRSASSGS